MDDGTARAGEDYTPLAGTLVFPIGITSRTILVPTNPDGVGATPETFNITLSNPSENATIGDGDAVATLMDLSDPVFVDSFEDGAWNGLWAEDAQDDWFTSTQRASDGDASAEVDGAATDATLTIAQTLDMTPYGGAELTFDWFIERGFDAGEYLALDFSPDGETWTEVARLSGNVDQENAWHSETVAVAPAFLTGGFEFRFQAKVPMARLSATSGT